jgi:tripartite-type tricarboxylate transporter receptor subunit TctC
MRQTTAPNFLKLCLAMACLGFAGTSTAQTDYPKRSVRLIVPAAPGGAADFFARLIGPKLSGALGQSVVIENRSGASGTIAADLTAKAPGDGYTVLIGQSTSMVVAPHMFEKLAYDTQKDLTPVTLVAEIPNVLVVHPSQPVNNVQELIALAKAKPGSLNYSSSGKGAPTHLAGEMFEIATGVQMTHVPYRGAGPATNALLAGEVQLMFGPAVAVMPQVRNGRIRALAVTSAQRSVAAPELPTLAESGLKGFEITSWFGLFVPSSTPAAVIDKLQRETAAALKQADVQARFAKEGAVAGGNAPAEFARFVRAEYQKFGKLIKEKGIKSN